MVHHFIIGEELGVYIKLMQNGNCDCFTQHLISVFITHYNRTTSLYCMHLFREIFMFFHVADVEYPTLINGIFPWCCTLQSA